MYKEGGGRKYYTLYKSGAAVNRRISPLLKREPNEV